MTDRIIFWLWDRLPFLCYRVGVLDEVYEWDPSVNEGCQYMWQLAMQACTRYLHRASPRTVRYFHYRCPRLAAMWARYQK